MIKTRFRNKINDFILIKRRFFNKKNQLHLKHQSNHWTSQRILQYKNFRFI